MKKLIFLITLLFFIPVAKAYQWCDPSVIPNDVRFAIIKFFCLIINVLLNSPILVKLFFMFFIFLIIFYSILKRIRMV